MTTDNPMILKAAREYFGAFTALECETIRKVRPNEACGHLSTQALSDNCLFKGRCLSEALRSFVKHDPKQNEPAMFVFRQKLLTRDRVIICEPHGVTFNDATWSLLVCEVTDL